MFQAHRQKQDTDPSGLEGPEHQSSTKQTCQHVHAHIKPALAPAGLRYLCVCVWGRGKYLYMPRGKYHKKEVSIKPMGAQKHSTWGVREKSPREGGRLNWALRNE